MARQLKVFSTPAGFVNAVVAAPSQKAALEAWGVHDNLFASGRASVVTDPELIARALGRPGEIVRVPIGTDEAILAAAAPPPSAAGASPPRTKPASKKEPRRPPPPPDRSALTAAEAALAAVEDARARELERRDDELRRLEAERREKKAELDDEVDAARATREEARRAFRAAGGVA